MRIQSQEKKFQVKVHTQQTFVLMKTSSRRLQDVCRLRLQKTSSRRLGQDEYIRLTLRLQKTSLRRLQDVLIKTNTSVLVIRLQAVFKTFSRRLQDVSKRLQDLLQKRLQDIFKTSSRSFEHVFKTSCKDVFKTFSRGIIKSHCFW